MVASPWKKYFVKIIRSGAPHMCILIPFWAILVHLCWFWFPCGCGYLCLGSDSLSALAEQISVGISELSGRTPWGIRTVLVTVYVMQNGIRERRFRGGQRSASLNSKFDTRARMMMKKMRINHNVTHNPVTTPLLLYCDPFLTDTLLTQSY